MNTLFSETGLKETQRSHVYSVMHGDNTGMRAVAERGKMDYETAADCWRQIEVSQLTEQRLEIVRAAINYSKRRVEWKLVWPEQRLEMGPARTAAHNAFIDACNTLGRNMVKAGESTRWRSHVGNEREELGDFACFIVLFIGLAAR